MWKTGSKTKIEYEGVLSFLELASAYEHQIYDGLHWLREDTPH